MGKERGQYSNGPLLEWPIHVVLGSIPVRYVSRQIKPKPTRLDWLLLAPVATALLPPCSLTVRFSLQFNYSWDLIADSPYCDHVSFLHILLLLIRLLLLIFFHRFLVCIVPSCLNNVIMIGGGCNRRLSFPFFQYSFVLL